MSAILRDALAKLQTIDTRLGRHERATRESEDRDRQARRVAESHLMRQHQARVDSALEPWGTSAKPPIEGQSFDSYRRTTLEQARLRLAPDHPLRRVDPYAIADDATLGIFEQQIYPAARAAAHSPDTVPPGEFRAVPEVDASGRRSTRFVGPQSFIHQFTLPTQRVVRLIARDAHSGRERVLHGPAFSVRDYS